MVAPTAAARGRKPAAQAEEHLVEAMGKVAARCDSSHDDGIFCGRTGARPEPSTPNVDATALQLPSTASLTMLPAVEIIGFFREAAPPECSIPGHRQMER